jgi:hypothetical protein
VSRWVAPTRSSGDLALPASFNAGEGSYEDGAGLRTRKERLLRQSLDLASGEHGNEEAVADIVSKALEAGLFDSPWGPRASFHLIRTTCCVGR